MPDKRRHRGPHPKDAELFRAAVAPGLVEATGHLSWLLTRGYAGPSALKLVGDRFALRERQRKAVMRCACSDPARALRRERERAPAALAGSTLWVDGLNVLTTIEAALSGGVIIRGRDGAYRDLASVHGTWRKVDETLPAVSLCGEACEALALRDVRWLLDRPVSNSGRLRAALERAAAAAGWPWRVELVQSPDGVLVRAPEPVAAATSDSGIIDRTPAWFDLARFVIGRAVPDAWVVDLDPGGPGAVAKAPGRL